MVNEILSYISTLAFFKIQLLLCFQNLIALLPCVQTSKFCCIASAAWLGKVIFTEKKPALPKWITNPSIYMGIVLIHTWKITFALKKYCMNVHNKASRKDQHGQTEKKKNLKKPVANRFSIFNVGAELCDCLIKRKGKSV